MVRLSAVYDDYEFVYAFYGNICCCICAYLRRRRLPFSFSGSIRNDFHRISQIFTRTFVFYLNFIPKHHLNHHNFFK